MDEHAEPLTGGYINRVVRQGDTVRRTPSERAVFVHRLLDHFEHQDWDGAPRFLGIDEAGRETLSFVDGVAGVDPSVRSRIASVSSLKTITRLVREFHDLTAGTELAGEDEVVCHNDLDPRNTIYRDQDDELIPIAFIDWDIAAPGRRIHDVARIAWQYLGLGPDITDLGATAQLIRLICDSYGLSDRDELLGTVIWWQNRCWQGINAEAAAGYPAMIHLRDSGVSRLVAASADWTSRNRAALESAL